MMTNLPSNAEITRFDGTCKIQYMGEKVGAVDHTFIRAQE
jgi:hypothetical protein